MKRLLVLCGTAAALVALCGCASQQIVMREFYPPDEKTAVKREDGLTVGALKSEAVKSGQPDWSTKNISILTVGL